MALASPGTCNPKGPTEHAPCLAGPDANRTSRRRAQDRTAWPKAAARGAGKKTPDIPTSHCILAAGRQGDGAAVVICPGGATRPCPSATKHGRRPVDGQTRRGRLRSEYRVAPYNIPFLFRTPSRALRTRARRAKEWASIRSASVSWASRAGGHLASTAATHYDDGKADFRTIRLSAPAAGPNSPSWPTRSSRSSRHSPTWGRAKNLLGADADEKLVQACANDEQVTDKTRRPSCSPPATDGAVPVENSVLFYQALRKAKVPAELHVYDRPTWRRPGATIPPCQAGADCLEAWMKDRGRSRKEDRPSRSRALPGSALPWKALPPDWTRSRASARHAFPGRAWETRITPPTVRAPGPSSRASQYWIVRSDFSGATGHLVAPAP